MRVLPLFVDIVVEAVCACGEHDVFLAARQLSASCRMSATS